MSAQLTNHRLHVDFSTREQTEAVVIGWGSCLRDEAIRQGAFDERPQRITAKKIAGLVAEHCPQSEVVYVSGRHTKYSTYWQQTSYPYWVAKWEKQNGVWIKTKYFTGTD